MARNDSAVTAGDPRPEDFGRRRFDVDGRSMIVVLLLIYLIVLIRTAWVCDDAYITFRTIDNFVNGYGLCWNVAERVQSFTHPLWLFLMAFVYLFTGEFFFTSIFVSVSLSVAALVLMVKYLSRSLVFVMVALAVLTLSKAFTDFSTSGLENPLTHLLLVLFLLVYFRFEKSPRSLALLSLIAALGALNRSDTLLLYLPMLLHTVVALRVWRAIGPVMVGFVPFLLWELFSFFYYGSFVPNTAYAKLGAGIDPIDRLSQGLAYLLDSVSLDPLTLLAVGAGVVIAFAGKFRGHVYAMLGALLYLVYTVWVGGDFMSGRFFTAPLLVAAVVISRLDAPRSAAGLLGPVAAVLLVGLTSPYCPLYSGKSFGSEYNLRKAINGNNGIADERSCYYPNTGLLNWQRGVRMPDHPWAIHGEALSTGDSGNVVIGGVIGFIGFYAGPRIHILDVMSLSDPLLSRMQSPNRTEWRPGHLDRPIPDGYIESLETGENKIQDSALAVYYDKLSLVTRGNLFSWNRIRTAIDLSLGRYDHLLDVPVGPVFRVSAEDLQQPVVQGSRWDAEGNIRLDPPGIAIDVRELDVQKYLEISLDHNDEYALIFVHDRVPIDSITLAAANLRTGGMAIHKVALSDRVVSEGLDEIWLYPRSGDHYYCVGHIRFVGESDTVSTSPP